VPPPCARRPPREALGTVDLGQLALLLLGHDPHLLALDGDLALEELALALHADVLAGGHREGTGKEAGDAGEDDELVVGDRTGNAHDQREVAHQPVVGAEDGGAQRARLAAAVPCLLAHVGVGGLACGPRRGCGCRRGHGWPVRRRR
jgi:hypothetical protein